jgi:hypothetical protein
MNIYSFWTNWLANLRQVLWQGPKCLIRSIEELQDPAPPNSPADMGCWNYAPHCDILGNLCILIFMHLKYMNNYHVHIVNYFNFRIILNICFIFFFSYNHTSYTTLTALCLFISNVKVSFSPFFSLFYFFYLFFISSLFVICFVFRIINMHEKSNPWLLDII